MNRLPNAKGEWYFDPLQEGDGKFSYIMYNPTIGDGNVYFLCEVDIPNNEVSNWVLISELMDTIH